MNPKTLAAARRAYLAGEIPAADNVPCVCKAPRSEHAGKSNAGGHAGTECTRYRADKLAETVARAAAAVDHGFGDTMTAYDRLSRSRMQKKKPGTVSVRPSDIGGCRRAVYYRETPPEDYTPAPSPRGAAWMGTLIHEEFLRRRAALYPWRLYADYDDSLAIRLPGSDRGYRYDEYDPVTARLISCKTAGSWRWDKTRDGADDKWWDQDHAYAWALREKGYPVETIEILVIERESGKSERFVEPYSEERAQRALSWIQALALELELGMVPPRDEPGPSLSKLCSTYCPAREHCWQMDRAESLGRSPESLIELGESPEDEAIELIAADLVEAREARLEAEKHEKQLKALLDGVELRPYGEFEPCPNTSTSTSWTEYRETVETWWNEPIEIRPETPPIPRQNRSVSYTWKRLRKATRDAMAKAKKEAEAKAATEQEEQPELQPAAS